MPLTIGELRELTKDMPEDTLIVSRDDNYELRGAITAVNKHSIKIQKFKREKQSFRDDFNGTRYQSEVFVPVPDDSEEGEQMLRI